MTETKSLIGAYASNKLTDQTVKVTHDNLEGGLYVTLVGGPRDGRRTWFQRTDLKDFRHAP